MPRERHGQYDNEHQLPDNTGQPVGSGLIIWLHEQICQLLSDGETLVEESRAHGSDGTKWLLQQLSRQEEAGPLVAEYHVRRKRDAVEREWEYKASLIRGIEADLASQDEMSHQRREYLEKDLAKRKRLFAKHLAQQQLR